MIAIIFEVTPADGRRDDDLSIAAALRPDLEAIEVSASRPPAGCSRSPSGQTRQRSHAGAPTTITAKPRLQGVTACSARTASGSPAFSGTTASTTEPRPPTTAGPFTGEAGGQADPGRSVACTLVNPR